MNTHRLVLPGDLNEFGFLFGGQLLKWVDEASWIAASLEYPNCKFVTVGMEDVSFKHFVNEGTILTFESTKVREGKTSITYAVEVHWGRHADGPVMFSTRVSFVNVDENGDKQPLKG